MTDVELGKFISYILRHHPEDVGIKLDKNGYANVSDLITNVNATKKYHNELSEERLQRIVDTNDKKRYSYDETGTKIRAVQGHSFHVDVAKKSIPPITLYHGTSKSAYDIIRKKGINKMNRGFVHLSSNKDTAIAVGMRHAKRKENLVILEIDVKKMFSDGYDFYVAENGVWLTDFVPAKYISTTHTIR